ncbi:MAG: hypothetical protein KKF50_01855 [Nanoarchaeota archaeon]|nr:hypothetical protein [Nanoarchaeota archaeon]
MKKIFLILVLGIFLLNSASAFSICIDKDPPSLMNSSLSLTATSGIIQLSWIPATDIPSCSGIDHYEIYRSTDGTTFSFIGNSSTNTYTDSEVSSGVTYYYMIGAFDLAGNNEADESLSHSVPISLIIESGTETRTSGGGGGSGGGIDNFFSCGDWGECINGTQIRICVEVGGSLPDRIESRDCLPEFEPLSFEGTSSTEGIIEDNKETQSIGFLTGAVIGVTDFAKTGKGIGSIIFVLGIVGAFVVTKTVRKRNERLSEIRK